LAFLFPDTQVIVQKAPDDLTALVKTRVAEHQAAEERKRALAAAAAAPAPVPGPAPAVATPVATPSPAPTVIAMSPRIQPAGAVPTLSIGLINERLQHFTVTAEGLRGLGFEPAGRERAAPRYHEADFPHMLAAIVTHVQGIQAKQAA